MATRVEAVLSRKNRINQINTKLKKHKILTDELKEEKRRLEFECIDFLKKEGVDKVSDRQNNVSIKTQEVPTVNDFNSFWNFIRKRNAPELITHGVNSAGWREHDMNVPGVGIFTRESLSITKR